MSLDRMILAGAMALFSATCGASGGDEAIIEYRRATYAPGTIESHENPFHSLVLDPWLEACEPCEVLEWPSPSGLIRTLHVSLQPEARFASSEIQRVIIREQLPFGGETSFFAVEFEPATSAAPLAASLARLGGRLMVIRIQGTVVGVEGTSPQWRDRPRIGSFASEVEAARVARRTGIEPIIERLSVEERRAERQRFIEFASDFFWINVCDPASATAAEQDALWTKTKAAYPELIDRIDCSESDRPEISR